jgi:hypothetical protein
LISLYKIEVIIVYIFLLYKIKMSIPDYRPLEIKEIQEMSDAPTLICMFVLGIIFGIAMLFEQLDD